VVIEAVSPGLSNRERDYIDKRKQYQDRGIPEYWLIDPARATVTVLELVDGIYRELGVFRGEDPIRSSVISLLNLTAQQLLQAGGT
jgi:Uma2 family endonuclease